MAPCKQREDYRQHECTQWLNKVIVSRPDEVLFRTGLPSRPAAPPAPLLFERNLAQPLEHGATVTGSVYTDGTLKVIIPCALLVGWAHVVTNQVEQT